MNQPEDPALNTKKLQRADAPASTREPSPPEKAENPQARRTREWLRSALIELMKEKPLSEISINELVQKSDLSRSAFYNHYADKLDILREYAEELYIGYIDTVTAAHTVSQFENWKILLQHYADNKEFYILILQNDLLPMLYDIQMKYHGLMGEAVERTLARSIKDKELYYSIFVPYHRSAELRMTLEWLQGSIHKSLDDMAWLFYSFSSQDAYENFRMLLSKEHT